MASKHYYLFNIRVWSVVIEMPEAEEIEEVDEEAEGTGTLSAAITLSADDRPAFGFTPWTPEPWGDYED
jgi:rRNA maturation endonuclease Nob1